MADTITVVDNQGGKREVDDTPENRTLAKDHGFEIEQGLVGQALDFHKGYSEGSIVGRAGQSVANTILDTLGVQRHNYEPSLPDHAGKITVVDPSGGRREVSDSDENRELAKTHGFSIEQTEDTKAHDIASLPEFQGARGAGHVFSKKLESEYLYGLPEMAQESSMTPEQRKAWELIKDEHQTASITGSAIGITGNLLTPGLNFGGGAGVAAKAEGLAARTMGKLGIEGASLGGKVALGAGKQAAAAAVYSAPHAIGQAVFDDPASAGEGMASGIGIGAVLGGAGPLAGKFINVVKPLAANKIEAATASRLAKLLGSEVSAEEARAIQSAGIIKAGMSRDAVRASVDKLGTDSTERAGSLLNQLDEHAAAANPELKSEAFRPADVIKAINDNVVANKVGPFYQKDMRVARDAMKQILASSTGAEVKLKGSVEEQIAQLVAHSETQPAVSLAKGHEIEQLFARDLTKTPGTLSEKDALERQMHRAVSDELSNATERLGTKAERPDLIEQYGQAKRQSRAALQPEGAPEEHGGFGAAHIGSMLGMGHATAHGASGLVGGIGGMLASYAAKRVVESSPFQTTLIAGGDKAARVLRALAAEQVMSRIQQLDDAIAKVGTRASQAALNSDRKADRHDVSPISSLMGGSERDGRKALDEMTTKLDALMANPDKLNSHLQSMASTVADSGDPEAAMGMMQAQMNALQYLHENVPRQKLAHSQFYNPEYRPTAQEIRDFEERCAAAQDPFYLTRKIEDGTLNSKHIDAVKRVYPGIGDVIAKRIESMGYENALKQNPTNLPYDARLRLQRLNAVGSAAAPDATSDPALVARLQANYSKKSDSGSSKPMKSIGNVASKMDRLQSK